ncbi:hypothetical protein FGIG_04778 [Fasciola gigantica]|uniref:Uncharacterized protein n=1 Tax=Fasciola gigantica TaxID=46835 RepID=A0A504Y986_FASGI|nr:hypothetical protein FGIG_04778 [Fasciola gigantica]
MAIYTLRLILEQWKSLFSNDITLLLTFGPSIELEDNKLKLLGHLVGDEGQRQFGNLNLNKIPTLTAATEAFDNIVGSKINVITARFRFSRSTQRTGEPQKKYISRLVTGIHYYEYLKIPQKKSKGSMLIKKCIPEIVDDRLQDALLKKCRKITVGHSV